MNHKKKVILAVAGCVAAAVILVKHTRQTNDNDLCRRSNTTDDMRAVLIAENVIGGCDLDALRAKLATLGIRAATYPEGDSLGAITQCPDGFLRRRGFVLDLRLKNGCVEDVHIERHDTGL